MSEAEYISALVKRWPRPATPDVSLETLALADEAVGAFPASTKLLIMRGNLITLGPEESPNALEDALACYQRAVALDPHCIEAWEELGHYHDVIVGDESAAQRYFAEAERLKGANVA